MGPVEARIREKLTTALSPDELLVINESGMHSVPPGSETHFKVGIVSPRWEGQGLLARHRVVHELLRDELAAGLHALSIEAWTPEQWSARGGHVAPSPACKGGGKGDQAG